MKFVRLAPVVAFTLSVPAPAVASRRPPLRENAITTDPLSLLVGMVTAGYERALSPNDGLEVSAGAGAVSGVGVFGVGVGYRRYLFGDFETGGYVNPAYAVGLASDGVNTATVQTIGVGFGGRYTADSGFLVGGQVGFGWVDGTPTPLLGSELGWAF